MPHLYLERAHTLPAEKLKPLLVENLAREFGGYDVRATWQGLRCAVYHKLAAGEVRIEPGKVVFDLRVSILARHRGLDWELLQRALERMLVRVLHQGTSAAPALTAGKAR